MQLYSGHKRILAKPMTRQAYNDYRGWTLPADEDGSDAGYLVEYLDGPEDNRNHPAHAGYISWSPADVFDAAYRPNGAMTFGDALEALKAGKRVARWGWNGKGMWLRLICPETGFRHDFTDVFSVTYEQAPHIAMKTADNKVVPWLASQTDMLAEDWHILKAGDL